MPNHVLNVMTIEGEKSKIEEFINKYVQKHKDKTYLFDFDKMIPMPKELEDTDMGWYHWRVANWGTKWPGYNTEVNFVDENKVEVTFQTAWDYPKGIYEFLAKEYPDFNFTIHFVEEGGMPFYGDIIIENGDYSEFVSDDEEGWREYAEMYWGYEFNEEGEYV